MPKQIIKITTVLLLLFYFCLSNTSLAEEPIASIESASLFFVIDKASYLDPELLHLNIEISPNTIPINAVLAGISYDPADLELLSINTASSCPLLINQYIDNGAGQADIICGTLEAIASSSPVAHLIFRKLNVGFTKLKFNSYSSVSAADGLGTTLPLAKEVHNVYIIK